MPQWAQCSIDVQGYNNIIDKQKWNRWQTTIQFHQMVSTTHPFLPKLNANGSIPLLLKWLHSIQPAPEPKIFEQVNFLYSRVSNETNFGPK